MIEQRLKEAGVQLASVQPDGTDRIRIFLPGVMKPERVTAVFARRVKVGVRLIDLSMPPEQAQSGTPPAGTEVLLGFKDKTPLSGRQGQRARRRGHQRCRALALPPAPRIRSSPSTSTDGARGVFAHLTEENIGKAHRHRARGQGDLRARDPRAHRRRLGSDLWQFYPGRGQQRRHAVARRFAAGAPDSRRAAGRPSPAPSRKAGIAPAHAGPPRPGRPPRSTTPRPVPGAPEIAGAPRPYAQPNGQLPKRPIRLKFASCGTAAEGFIQAVVIRFRL